MEKKYQIFISSTYTDLVEERKKVRDTILAMLHFPVGMEVFGAADEEQWEIIKDTIDSSDYYILIIGQRYGSVIIDGPDAGISYTEKEFRYARNQQVPILAFIIDDSVPLTKDKMEHENQDKLNAFINEVKSGRLIEYWNSSDDLAQKVSISLRKQMDRKQRPGWVRENCFDMEESLNQLLELNQRVIELEKKNRKLSEELTVYRQEEGRRIPKLTITMDVDAGDDDYGKMCHLDYAVVDQGTSIHGVRVLKLPAFDDVRQRYKARRLSDFPVWLRNYARKDEINEYNESLPTESDVSKYIENLARFHQITDSCVHIKVGVNNIGTAKANNVFVEMCFPEEISVFDDSVLNLEEPKAPECAADPVVLAEKRSNALYNYALDMQSIYGELADPFSSPRLRRPISVVFSEEKRSYRISNNTLYFECESIIHTRNCCSRGIFLVGKKAGHYQIKCTLMCEEYKEPQIEYIDFEVV